MKPKFIKVQI